MKPLQPGFVRIRIFRGWQNIDTWDLRVVPRIDEYVDCGGCHGVRQINDITYHKSGLVDLHVSR